MSYGFQSTNDALTALQDELQGIQYQAAPLFSKVALFDMTDLAAALIELLTFGNRICLVVHDNEYFENERKGADLHSRQTRNVTLLMADRHFANRQVALFGDGDKTPGALAIKDMVLNEVVGPLIPGAMFVEPVHGEQVVLEKKIRDQLQGRVAFTLGLRLVGGNVIVNLGRTPIV